jgi:hypothetical protein
MQCAREHSEASRSGRLVVDGPSRIRRCGTLHVGDVALQFGRGMSIGLLARVDALGATGELEESGLGSQVLPGDRPLRLCDLPIDYLQGSAARRPGTGRTSSAAAGRSWRPSGSANQHECGVTRQLVRHLADFTPQRDDSPPSPTR